MTSDLTTSQHYRQNILNNSYALKKVEEYLELGGILFEGELIFTKEQLVQVYDGVRLLPIEELNIALEEQSIAFAEQSATLDRQKELTEQETQRADRAAQRIQELEAQIASYQQTDQD